MNAVTGKKNNSGIRTWGFYKNLMDHNVDYGRYSDVMPVGTEIVGITCFAQCIDQTVLPNVRMYFYITTGEITGIDELLASRPMFDLDDGSSKGTFYIVSANYKVEIPVGITIDKPGQTFFVNMFSLKLIDPAQRCMAMVHYRLPNG